MIRVMIVEDEPSAAERYAAYVSDFGHGFVVGAICHQASEALERFRDVDPEVILTDIRMPGESGLSLVDKLRHSGWRGQVIVISGYDEFSYAREAIRLEAAEYLLKPVFPEDLRNALARLSDRLGQSPAGDDSTERLLLGEAFSGLPEFLKRALRFVAVNYQHRVSLREAAKSAFVSSAYLSASFKRLSGYTFVEYLRRYRIEIAKRLLATTSVPLDEVAARVGIGDAAYFNRLFKRVERLTPGRYRRIHREGVERPLP